MGKRRFFLGFSAILFVLISVGAALAAGYTCDGGKKYTSCKYGYYLSGGNVVGNSCAACTLAKNTLTTGTSIPHGSREYKCIGYYTTGKGDGGSGGAAEQCDGCSEQEITCICNEGFDAKLQGTSECFCEEPPEISCDPGKYLFNGQCRDCPNGYTSIRGATAIEQCYKTCYAYCIPGNCPDHTVSCEVNTSSRSPGMEFYHGSCDAAATMCGFSALSCDAGYYLSTAKTDGIYPYGSGCTACGNTKPSNSHFLSGQTSSNCAWECDSGYHKNAAGTACESNCSTSKACSSLGAEWTGTYNECTGNQSTQCYKTETVYCSNPGNNTECPANASACTYDTSNPTNTCRTYYGSASCTNTATKPKCNYASITCNTGFYKSGNQCPQCTNKPANSYYTGSGTANDCPWQCNAGFYKNGNTCTTCPAGKFCPAGTTTPQDCPAGRYSDQGQSDCTQCPAGTFCPNKGTVTPTNCATGSTSGSGATACTACQTGKTTSGVGKASCDANCSNNANVATWETATWTNNSVTNLCKIKTCNAAVKGTGAASATNSITNNACVYSGTCNAGYVVPAASNNTIYCTACPTAYPKSAQGNSYGNNNYCYLTLTTGQQVATTGAGATNCSKGRYCTSTANIYKGTGTTTYTGTACVAGSYQDTEGQSQCKPCAAGKTNSGTGNTAACTTACTTIANLRTWAATQWNSNNTVSNLCTVDTCVAGSYKTGNTCPVCDANKYSNAGASACAPCKSGTNSDGTYAYTTRGNDAGAHATVEACKIDCSGTQYVPTAEQGCVTVGKGYYGRTAATTTVTQTQTLARTQCPLYYRDGQATTKETLCETHCPDGQYVASAREACKNVDDQYYNTAHIVHFDSTSESEGHARQQCPTAATIVAGAIPSFGDNRQTSIGHTGRKTTTIISDPTDYVAEKTVIERITNASSITQCYLEDLPYGDYEHSGEAEHGRGRQTCFADNSRTYYTNCFNKRIDWCYAGYYWHPDKQNYQQSKPDCQQAEIGFYSVNGPIEQTHCPAEPSFTIHMGTDTIEKCIKRVEYKHPLDDHGVGHQYCYWTSGNGDNAIYDINPSDLGTNITYEGGDSEFESNPYAGKCYQKWMDKCVGGYYWPEQQRTGAEQWPKCEEVGVDHYSEVNDLNRYSCPPYKGVTGVIPYTTADTPKACFYGNDNYRAEHGGGYQGCYYTSGLGDGDYSVIYDTNCGVKLTYCDAGYYEAIDRRTDDCEPAGYGAYSPNLDRSRKFCPTGYTTQTETSTTAVECIKCYKNYICTPGIQKTCSEISDGEYPDSDEGSTDSTQCYRDCNLDPNATEYTGHDYFNAANTCKIARCAVGYYINTKRQTCDPCPTGMFCDGTGKQCDADDPTCDDTNGAVSCSSVKNKDGIAGLYPYAAPGATSSDLCYRDCNNDILGKPHVASYTGHDYFGGSTCKVEKCDPGYRIDTKINACVPCTSGMYCPGDSTVDPCPADDTKCEGKRSGELSCSSVGDGTYTESYPGATVPSDCYRPQCKDERNTLLNLDHVASYTGHYYYTNNTCKVEKCEPGYRIDAQNNQCVQCTPGMYCPGDDTVEKCPADDRTCEGKNGEISCSTLGDHTYTESATGADSMYKCYRPDSCFHENNGFDHAHVSLYSGYDFYGEGNATCKVSRCEAGYFINTATNKCQPCPEGYFCDAQGRACPFEDPDCVGTTGAVLCSTIDDHTFVYSAAGATDKGQCYRDCFHEGNAFDHTEVKSYTGLDYFKNPTCKVAMCNAGFSINTKENACQTCPENMYCDAQGDPCPADDPTCNTGGKNTTGAVSCKDVGDHTFVLSAPGADDSGWCYRADKCFHENNGFDHTNVVSYTGYDYFKNPTCKVALCDTKYSINTEENRCELCPAGNYCPGPDVVASCPFEDKECTGTTGAISCAGFSDGSWKYSAAGSWLESDCYRSCETLPIQGGIKIPRTDHKHWPDDCEFDGWDYEKNPCVIENEVCVAKLCKASYEMINGKCTPCDRENALTYKEGGNCLVETCRAGYHPYGDKCVADVIECTAPNATLAEMRWDKNTGAFGLCTIKECDDGFHISSNACVTDTQECEVEHGRGERQWKHDTNTWGECIATYCEPGFTNDPYESNEPTKQCGNCKNKFGVDGEIAASTYSRGCTITACMYQGEMYNLENNECNPICSVKGYEDDTGSMRWNPVTHKCERTCKDGYTMW